MLQSLICNFFKTFIDEHNDSESDEISERLEEIDGETDNLDITFVKMADPRYARKWGVTKLPAIVYFRKRFPSIFRGILSSFHYLYQRFFKRKLLTIDIISGDLHNELDVLEWLKKNRYRQPELNIYMYMLIALGILFAMYTGFLLTCFKSEPAAPAPHPKQAWEEHKTHDTKLKICAHSEMKINFGIQLYNNKQQSPQNIS